MNTNKQALNLIKLLKSYVSKDKARLAIMDIWLDSEKSKLVATNGRAILTVDSNLFYDLPDHSCYVDFMKGQPVKLNRDCKYPNYEQVIPKTEGEPKLTRRSPINDNLDLSNFIYNLYKHTCVNINFLLPLVKSGEEKLDVYVIDELSGVTIKNNRINLVIMPLRLS